MSSPLEEGRLDASKVGADAKADAFFLEDESGRCKMAFKTGVSHTNHGAVVAALGTMDDDNVFHVDHVQFRPPNPPTPYDMSQFRGVNVLFISGVHFGSTPSAAELLALLPTVLPHRVLWPLLLECLGDRGDVFRALERYVRSMLLGTARVVMAGNMLATPQTPPHSTFETEREYTKRRAAAVQEFDVHVARLARFAHVDLMPGFTDPARNTLPQPPLPEFLFPRAATMTKTFTRLSNPASMSWSMDHVIGTSGQAILDMLRHSDVPDSVTAMQLTLAQRHLAPTAPDTLSAHPLTTTDPLVLTEVTAPRIYFAGNQPAFQCLYSNTMFIAIPVYQRTGSIVELNMDTLRCRAVELRFPPSGTTHTRAHSH
jgi:hypothetical protein